MASNKVLLSELYKKTLQEVTSSPQNWMSYLHSASRNYKFRFDEQLLVYAQKPDATAVLTIRKWNKLFGRVVNRGSVGIGVFPDTFEETPKIQYYFDISDTHETKYAKEVPIWQYQDKHVTALQQAMSIEADNSISLEQMIYNTITNEVSDVVMDYAYDFVQAIQGSYLEELDEENLTAIYRNLIINSVAYMIYSRLEIEHSDFYQLTISVILLFSIH